MSADRYALRVVTDRSGVLDVLLDGHRVWSVDLDEPTATGHGVSEFAWPAALAERLDGTALLELREHGQPAAVASARCQFGTSTEPVVLTDARGRLLSVSKWGRLNQSFADLDPDDLAWYLDRTQLVLDVLADDLGRPSFLAYGSLLGAVRSGAFIGHDMDVDLGYLSEAVAPVDAMRESFAVERQLRARGWRVRRQNGGFLQLFFEQPGGAVRNLDVFTMMAEPGEGRLYMINDTMIEGDRDTVLPLGQVSLQGRLFPSPRRAEALLEGAYGPGWRVPDPAFSYGASPGKRQMKQWFGGFREDRDRWNRFYRDTPGLAPTRPSAFAEWVVPQVRGTTVIDLGCGLGRDTRRYARRRPALGLDVSPFAVRRARRRTPAGNRAQFDELNLGSLRQTLAMGALVARRFPGPRSVTAHETLDAMSASAREHVWSLCRMLLRGGGQAFVQFATAATSDDEDAAATVHEFTQYPGQRRFVLDPDEVQAAAEAHAGRVLSREMLPAEQEGLPMCRMVLAWD